MQHTAVCANHSRSGCLKLRHLLLARRGLQTVDSMSHKRSCAVSPSDTFLRFCQVYLARWKCALVACKVLREEQVGSAELESFRQEAEMLQAMNHPYVLRLFGAVLDSHRVRLFSLKLRIGRVRSRPARPLHCPRDSD